MKTARTSDPKPPIITPGFYAVARRAFVQRGFNAGAVSCHPIYAFVRVCLLAYVFCSLSARSSFDECFPSIAATGSHLLSKNEGL